MVNRLHGISSDARRFLHNAALSATISYSRKFRETHSPRRILAKEWEWKSKLKLLSSTLILG